MDRVIFKMGEKKYVCISVRSAYQKVFDVTSAKYVLKNGNQEEASGDCEIDQRSDTETVLSALIQPMINKATYTLEYEYTIPPETLKYEVSIRVT